MKSALLLLASLAGAAASSAEQLWVRKPRSRSALLVEAGALAALCEKHGLPLSEMEAVAAGRRRQCRGWCCGPLERFVAEPEAAGGAEYAQSIADIFGVETTVIGRDGVPRSAPAAGADEAAPAILADDVDEEDEDEDEDEEDDEADGGRGGARARAARAAEDEDEEDEEERGSSGVAVSAGAAARQPSGLVGLLLSGQALPVLISPLVTLALAGLPKSLTTNLSLARNVFYAYALVFFAFTALTQSSIGALPEEAEGALAVRVKAPPSPAQAMQAALSGGSGPNASAEPEEVLMSQRAYDGAELAKLRSAVLSGAGLNLALSFVMKQRGASILFHRAIVGICELLMHPLFRAHVLPATGVFAGSALTRVTRPFPAPMGMMELMMKAGGGPPGSAGGVDESEDEEVDAEVLASTELA